MEQDNLDGALPVPLGPTLRQRLAERGLRARDLAEMVGVSTNTVSSWATGKHSPRRAHSEQIATSLGVSLDELYGRAPGSSAPKAAGPDTDDLSADAAQRLVQQLADLQAAGTALRELSNAAPPLLDVLAQAQALAERWSGPGAD